MRQILFLSIILSSLVSCVNQRQKSNITGRTDEVYFTPSDTRIKVYAEDISESKNNTEALSTKPSSGNYTGSYSDRLRNFGSGNRFSYNNYQPALVPAMVYNNYTGWTMGYVYDYPMYGNYGYNSAFSPYYGCNMPYNDPFYSNGWGGGWMTNYYPSYTYNPYFFGYNPYGYGNYGGYNNYNPYAYNNYNYSNNRRSTNYARRTGTTSPSKQNNTQTTPDNRNSNTSTNNSNTNNSGNSGGWWNSSSSSSSSSGSGRNTTGNTSSSTRRR